MTIHTIDSLFGSSRHFLIPEVGLAHSGSFTLACAYIDLVSKLGLTSIKFQHHNSAYESSPNEQFRTFDSRIISKSRYDYWNDTSFDISTWKRLVDYAHSKNLLFGITPNSYQSVAELLANDISIDFWKIGSSDIDNFHLLNFCSSEIKQPIIISTGLATVSAIEAVASLFKPTQAAFLSCHSSYPSTLIDFSLPRLDALSDILGPSFQVGLSDHSGSIAPILYSASHGYQIFEFHLSISPHIFNFDLSSSLTPENAKDLVLLLNQIGECSTSGQSSLAPTNSVVGSLFSKKLHYAHSLNPGDTVRFSDILSLRGTEGELPSSSYNLIHNRVLSTSVVANTPVSLSDFQ